MNAPQLQALQLMRGCRYVEAMLLLFHLCGTAPAAVYRVTRFRAAQPAGLRLRDFSANPSGACAGCGDGASRAGEKQDMRKQAGTAIAA